jgi:hypothetical protein
MRGRNEAYNAGDAEAVAATISNQVVYEDRRAGLGSPASGRDQERAVTAWLTVFPRSAVNVLAVRGERLALARISNISGEAGSSFESEMLAVQETDSQGLLGWNVFFDADDLAGAYAELEARYLAGDAAPQAATWRRIVDVYDGLNRRQLPRGADDLVMVDHRRTEAGGHSSPAAASASVRTMWELVPDLKIQITAVHRLSDNAALISCSMGGTSRDGVAAEWSVIELVGVDGDLVARWEEFSDDQLDAALARFGELRPAE